MGKSYFCAFCLGICTRDDQKVLGPLYFGLPGKENLTITFQYHPGKTMHLAHLCSSFLITSNRRPFPGPQILGYCLYAAFIASLLCTTKMGFQFWEQIEVRRSHIRGVWGTRKDIKSTFSRSSHDNL